MNNQKTIIFADPDYFPLLIRNKDKNSNVKLLPIREAISYLTFELNDQMIAALIKKDIEYTKAKQLILNIQLIGEKRINNAPQYLKDAYLIIKPFIKKHDFNHEQIFKNKRLYLFGASKDVEFVSLFKAYGYDVKHLSFNDVKINESFETTNKLLNFDNKMEQYMYVFADIRSKVEKDPSLVNSIQILVNDRYDAFYATLFSKLFNVDVYINLVESLYTQPIVIDALKKFNRSKVISSKEIKGNDDISKKLIQIIDTYDLEELSKTKPEKAYLNLLEICVQTSVSDDGIEDKGVVITDEFRFNNKQIYVLNFQDNAFYRFYKDTDAIKDIDKQNLNLNPSYIKTLIDKEKKFNYIKFNNVVHISRVKQHLDEHIYDSGLIDDLNLKQENFDYSNERCIDVLCKKSFTPNASNMLAAILADRGYDIKRFNKVKSYSNKVDEVKVETPKTYYVSAIQQYSECPFRYLLDNYAKLSTLDDYYFRDLGTLLHKVLENITSPVFEYGKWFDEAAETFKKNITMHSQGIYDKKYDAYLYITKKWFKCVVKKYWDELKSLSSKVDVISEVKFEFNLPGVEKKFTGKIDAILKSQGEEGKYYSIIDYKTGSTEFAPLAVCVGLNIQLPMYAYALPKSNKKSLIDGMTLGGFGLKHILGSSPKKYSNDPRNFNWSTLNSYMKAKLYCNKTDDLVKSLCHYTFTKQNKVKTAGFDQIVSFANNNLENNGYEFTIDIAQLCEQAKDVVIKTIAEIEACHFPIRVTPSATKVNEKIFEIKKRDTNCYMCKYADICYRNKDNFVDVSDYILKVWEGDKDAK